MEIDIHQKKRCAMAHGESNKKEVCHENRKNLASGATA